MSYRYRAHLIASTSALAIALSAAPAAWAEEAQQAQASRLEEITVTARRVEENVQKVPVSVVAIPEDQLHDLNISSMNDLNKISPGLWAQYPNGTFVWIRGLQGVARFFADAPADPTMAGGTFDIANVQVLKGPQGTYFGGASVAGAIVTMPKKPTDTFSGFADVRVGDYGARTIQGGIGGPIVEDKLLFRVAAESVYRKGYICAADSGKCYNDQNHYTIRGGLTFKTEHVESYTMLQYYYARENGDVRVFNDYAADPTKSYAVFLQTLIRILGPVAGPARADAELAQGKYRPYLIDSMNVNQGFSGEKKRSIVLVNNTRWDITDNISFTNIFQWRKFGFRSIIDQLNDPFFNVANDPRAIAARMVPLEMQPAWSDEAKFSAKLFDDFMTITAGTYHKGEPTVTTLGWSNSASSLQATYSKGSMRYPTLTRAVFAQADVDLGRYVNLDGLTFTAGYRYTWDTMSGVTVRLNVLPGVPTDQLKARTGGDLYGKAHFANDNWLFGLKWQYTPDTMFFVTASKAYTVGQTNPQFPLPYNLTDPETLKQLEGGFKSTFFMGDMQFRANTSVYYGWYSNIQVSVLTQVQINPPPAPPSLIVPQINAAKGLVRGADFELAALPTTWLEVTANVAYNKNKYTDWPLYAPGTTTVIGNNKHATYTGNPRLQWNMGVTFHVPMDEKYGKLSISGSYQHVSSLYQYAGANKGEFAQYSTHTAANGYGPLSADGALADNSGEFPYHNLDASVKWQDPFGVGGLTTTFSVTNITKNRRGYEGANAYYAAGYETYGRPPPRMFAVEFNYSF